MDLFKDGRAGGRGAGVPVWGRCIATVRGGGLLLLLLRLLLLLLLLSLHITLPC